MIIFARMIYHIVVGDMAAQPLSEAIQTEPSMEGEIVVIRDLLHIGPIKRGEQQKFSNLRSAYWQQLIVDEKNPPEVDDQERIIAMSNKLRDNEEAQVWFWMAPWAADVSAYHWTLVQLQKYVDRFHLLNLAGLPFLDDEGKVYYPKNLSEISPRELIKARKLARKVTPAELEVDGTEWEKLVEENGGVRVLEGGKKLTSKDADHYDNKLLDLCQQQFQKASKIIGNALSKQNIPTADTHLAWRLQVMAENGLLELQGDTTKTLKDFSVKLAGGNGAAVAENENADNEDNTDTA